MTKRGTPTNSSLPRRLARWFSQWLARWRYAFCGLLLAFRRPAFLVTFVLTFVIFGTLMSLLYSGTASLGLIFSLDFPQNLKVIADAFLGIFGFGRSFTDFLLLFSVTFLQASLVGLVVIVYRLRRQPAKVEVKTKTGTKTNAKAVATAADSSTPAHAERVGLLAGLAILGSGCPTCGTTLLAPVIVGIFGAGSLSLASTVSTSLTVAAIILSFFMLHRLGYDAYVALSLSRCHQTSNQEENHG